MSKESKKDLFKEELDSRIRMLKDSISYEEKALTSRKEILKRYESGECQPMTRELLKSEGWTKIIHYGYPLNDTIFEKNNRYVLVWSIGYCYETKFNPQTDMESPRNDREGVCITSIKQLRKYERNN